MPVIPAESGSTLDIEDRLRALLSADPDLEGRYTPPFREFTPSVVTIDDGVVVALFTADEDYTPDSFATMETRPRMLLTVSIAEPEKTTNPEITAIRRRLVSLNTLFRKTLSKYLQDPTPGDCFWWGLEFIQKPTTIFQREPQQYWRATTQFDVMTQEENP